MKYKCHNNPQKFPLISTRFFRPIQLVYRLEVLYDSHQKKKTHKERGPTMITQIEKKFILDFADKVYRLDVLNAKELVVQVDKFTLYCQRNVPFESSKHQRASTSGQSVTNIPTQSNAVYTCYVEPVISTGTRTIIRMTHSLLLLLYLTSHVHSYLGNRPKGQV